MRNFLRALLVLVIVIAVIILGVPLVIGFWIQKDYPNTLHRFSTSPNFTIKMVNFHRGWFSSDALLRVSLKLPGAADNSNLISIDLNEHIQHGPVIIARDLNNKTKIVLARALLITRVNTEIISLHSYTIWTFGNQLKGVFQIDSIHLSGPGQQAAIHNAQGQFNYEINTKRLTTNFHINSGEFTVMPANPLMLKIDNIQSNSNLLLSDVIWYGQRNFTIDHLGLQLPQKGTLDITGIAGKSVSSTSSGGTTTDIQFNFSTQKILSKDINLSNMEINIGFKSLNTNAFAALTSKVEEIQNSSSGGSALAAAELYQPVINFLSKGFTLELNRFHFDTTQGPVDLTGRLYLPQQTDSPSLEMIYEQGSASANLQISQPWMLSVLTDIYRDKQAKAQTDQTNSNNATTGTTDNKTGPNVLAQQDIDHWINAKLFVQDHNNLRLNLDFQKGKITINNAPLQQIIQALQQQKSTNVQTPQTQQLNKSLQNIPATPAPTPGSTKNDATADQMARLSTYKVTIIKTT